MTKDTALVHQPQDIARHESSVEEIIAQSKKIELAMSTAMRENVHYGTIPGTPKPTLYKAGAEKLCLLFRFDPQYQSAETRDAEHLIVKSVCTLWHIPTGLRLGSGEGSCSTRESKYAWRRAERLCPSCQQPAIIKGKVEYGGGWLCFKAKGGCGTKFKDGDAVIETQEVGRIPNPDLADQYNTVLKMANKRALVAAVLNTTAASDVFTQDLEDEEEPRGGPAPAREQPKPAPAKAPAAERPADAEPVINENQLKRLSAIASGQKWTDDQVHALIGTAPFSYASRKDIKAKDYEAIVDKLKAGPGKP